MRKVIARFSALYYSTSMFDVSHEGKQMAELRKHFRGCYRITLSGNRFGQITKGRYYTSVGGLQDRFEQDNKGRFWSAEIRASDTGTLLRYAGVWPSLKDAVEELTTIA